MAILSPHQFLWLAALSLLVGGVRGPKPGALSTHLGILEAPTGISDEALESSPF